MVERRSHARLDTVLNFKVSARLQIMAPYIERSTSAAFSGVTRSVRGRADDAQTKPFDWR
jgi:hypothetical protein